MVLFTFSNVTKLSKILISTLKACRCLRSTCVLQVCARPLCHAWEMNQKPDDREKQFEKGSDTMC